MFVGRKNELKKLNDFINSDITKAAIIFGRRRVGKSELINQCLQCSNYKYIYYECKQTTEFNNINSLADIVSETYDINGFSFESMEALIKFIYSSTKDNTILVLDEYPYLRDVINGLDSIIQTIIDSKNNSKVKLILCGSYIDSMKSLLDIENPLYGRFDLKLELKPMDYYDSSMFYPTFSNEDKVRLYSVFGGIPYYNKFIDPKKTVKENIIDLISSDGARLENEITGYLKTQLSKINNANEVIELLAAGNYRYKDIFEKSGVTKGPTLIDAIDKLCSMEIIEKVSPINDEHNKKKKGYVILDQLSNFYYKFIYKNKSRIKIMNSEIFYEKYINNEFETQYVPKAFELVGKEYLIRKNKEGLIDPPFDKIGMYYYDNPTNHTNGEFDVVTHDDNGYTFYEVKFKNSIIKKEMVEKEVKQVKESPLNGERFGFISKSDFDLEDDEITLITIDDMYK